MLLTDEFLAQYENRKPPFGGNGLGEFVYLRTYSRFLEDKNRREKWHETVRRVVEFNMSLHKGNEKDLVREAEKLYDYIFNLKVFPSGRSLWTGGSKASELFPLSNFNCAFTIIDSLESFSDVFYLLLVGAGIGFRILPTDVEKLPKFNTNIKLTNLPYNEIKENKTENTFSMLDINTSIYKIEIGDSKNGWINALSDYLWALIYDENVIYKEIEINYNNIRPEGSILKTFGGRASGYKPLMEMFSNIHKIITSSNGKLETVDVLDICNLIATSVVVGGVRRSSEIGLFDVNDDKVLNAKYKLWEEGSPNYGKNWRSMSNNTILFYTKPEREKLHDIFQRIKDNGEPGFANMENMMKRRPNVNGANPCFEILLDNHGTCNLSTVNLMAFVNPDKTYDVAGLNEAISLATRIGLRMTNLNLELPEWNETHKRDRLTGVSLTGIMDFVDATGISKDEFEGLLASLNATANVEAIDYAFEMRIPTPLLVTTVKPEGTISQLPTVSSGVHKNFAPYYIRRVRINATDPLAKAMISLGYKVYPENGQGSSVTEFDKLDYDKQIAELEKVHTLVIEFPVQTSATSKAYDENAISQLERYKLFQNYYTDHNTSITIYVGENEWEEVEQWVWDNWNDFIGVSFLPKDKTTYPLMPYEEITKQEYLDRVNNIAQTNLDEYLKLFEGEIDETLDPSCATGVCPTR